jgi:hypothetical protein
LRFTGGGGAAAAVDASDDRFDGFVVVGVEGWEDSEGVPLGTDMNLDPSLLVYLDIFRGDGGTGVAGFWLGPGMVWSTGLREEISYVGSRRAAKDELSLLEKSQRGFWS